MTDIKNMSEAELEAEIEQIKKQQAALEEHKRREDVKAQNIAEDYAKAAAKKEAARAEADRKVREAEWKPAGEITIPARCPKCNSELMKKPPKNTRWQCPNCGDHKH